MDVAEVAISVLEQILATPKGYVYASRRGICAGVVTKGESAVIVFRRRTGSVRLENWTGLDCRRRVETYALPPSLEKRAAEMLDDL